MFTTTCCSVVGLGLGVRVRVVHTYQLTLHTFRCPCHSPTIKS